MKKLFTLAVLMVITISAHAMSFTDAQREALYLTDKMAYELDLSPEQFEAVYEINFDYFYSVSHRRDIYGNYWSRRDSDLRFVLSPWQYDLYRTATYFYHPVYWYRGRFTFTIYSRYTSRTHFFRSRPTRYSTYRGGYNRGVSRYRGRTFNAPPTRPSTHQQGPFDHGHPRTSGNNPGNRPRTSGNTPSGSRPRTSGNTPSGSRPRTSGNTPSGSRPHTSGNTPSGSRPRTGNAPSSSRPRTSSSRSPHASGHK